MGVNRRGIVPVIGFVVVVLQLCELASANVVFQVEHKFARAKRSLSAVKSHDADRHRRFLAAADLPLGGDGSPTSAALYFTKIQIGSPPKDYHVQVDTGSDLLWVNCVECDKCPTESDLGIPLTLYDPKDSSSAKTVGCEEEFCTSTFNAPSSECKVGMLCAYSVTYGDGSATTGYFVNDKLQLAKASGDGQTSSMSGSVTFGCGAKQTGELGSSEQALDGIIGFGQANSSILSQLSVQKKVKKEFSHCLASRRGGGIFAIGEVVEPKVKTTPMLAEQTHYNVELTSIDVNGSALDLPKSLFDFGTNRGAIVDSGTTLAYFPDKVYKQIMEKIMDAQPEKEPFVIEEAFKCYKYAGDLDEGFPEVTFHFGDSLSLKVTPRQYFFEIEDEEYCIGFQNSKIQANTGGDLTLLGDLVLSDKLVTYNMEDQTIGWIDYNCSSSIKVKDEESGNVYEVIAHDISSSRRTYNSQTVLTSILFLVATLIIS